VIGALALLILVATDAMPRPARNPTIRGMIVMSDVASIRAWSGHFSASVRANKHVVARALSPIASGCAAK